MEGGWQGRQRQAGRQWHGHKGTAHTWHKGAQPLPPLPQPPHTKIGTYNGIQAATVRGKAWHRQRRNNSLPAQAVLGSCPSFFHAMSTHCRHRQCCKAPSTWWGNRTELPLSPSRVPEKVGGKTNQKVEKVMLYGGEAGEGQRTLRSG